MSYAKPIEHGTNSGYHAHRRRKEPACIDCKRAHAEAQKRYFMTPVLSEIAPHGTNRRYHHHLREDEEPCEHCKAAHAIYRRAQRESQESFGSEIKRKTIRLPLEIFSEMYWTASAQAQSMLDDLFGRNEVDLFLKRADEIAESKEREEDEEAL